MKKLLLLLLPLLFLFGCRDNSKSEDKEPGEDPLFGQDFRNYEELEALSNYEKEIDTSINMGGSQDKYRLMNLKKNNKHMVLFYKVTALDSQDIHPVAYRAIDTIQIDLENDERVTVGYCYHEDFNEGEIIAVIKENDSLYAKDIMKAWRANPESEKLELLQDHKGIECLNEFFESENSTIPLEEMT